MQRMSLKVALFSNNSLYSTLADRFVLEAELGSFLLPIPPTKGVPIEAGSLYPLIGLRQLLSICLGCAGIQPNANFKLTRSE